MSVNAAYATCDLCPHHCRLAPTQVGLCKARCNIEGAIGSLSSGKLTCKALDPIEKKPLVSFKPNSTVLSIGSFGCNMHCPWCQNASIAQRGIDGCRWEEFTPVEIAIEAKSLEQRGCIGVAYTYNEPTTLYEFIIECARIVHANNQDNVLVSNGLIESKPLRELASYIDAANIDLKCFDETLYRQIGGNLETVKATIETLVNANAHVEVTTLIVPGFNDSVEQIDALASWVANVDSSIVLHLTRFFPRYELRNAIPTPRATLDMCLNAALEHLPNARLGNV